MNRNNGLSGLVDMDMTHESLVGEVFAAYDSALDPEVLECMDVAALWILWDRRPNKEVGLQGGVCVGIDRNEIHDAHYSADKEHIPNRRGGEK